MITSMPVLAVLKPFINIGDSQLLSWLLSLAIIACIVIFVVWLVSKFAGPPSVPEKVRWIVWVVVAIALLVFLFAALEIKLP